MNIVKAIKLAKKRKMGFVRKNLSLIHISEPTRRS